MDYEKLIKLSERNEVGLRDFGKRKRTPPYYYSSLRHALGFYFSTFNTQNASYDSYAEGLYGRNVRILKGQLLDEDNTVLTIVAFERFFELFIKDLLGRVNRKLTYQSQNRLNRSNPVLDLIGQIQAKTFVAKKIENSKKTSLTPFRETLQRYYGLVDLVKNRNASPIVKKFARILKGYMFLSSDDNKASMKLLNYYRDRILHNGNELPTMWLLDFIITQRILPIVQEITRVEKEKLGESLFYFQTVTGINVIDKLVEVKFKFRDLRTKKKLEETFINLLYIGHLKELGRANLNMNIFVRKNWQATYEYNYKDPKGRGIRFAAAESTHPDFKEIKDCLCCGERSLVVYRVVIQSLFKKGEIENIDWVKCYTCDYHLRYNVGDPNFFDLNVDKIFV